FFVLYCTVGPRHLSSFPTRRSSDLNASDGSDRTIRRVADNVSRSVIPRALPPAPSTGSCRFDDAGRAQATRRPLQASNAARARADRKSTRLNSSHVEISYAGFCLKK